MTSAPHILAVDQGTSATKAVLVDASGAPVAMTSRRLTQQHPGPGRVEQSPEDIWTSVLEAVAALTRTHPNACVAGVALSTQRESVLAWDPATGTPLSPLVSWQDRRGTARCAELAAGPDAGMITRVTGLPVDPMFSATKAAALLDDLDPGRVRSRAGALRVGTVDAWLLRRITGVDRTEIGNASRTQLLDLDAADYHPELLELFRVPRAALPELTSSTGEFGTTDVLPGVAAGTPVAAVLGDSHASLFAHSAGHPGIVKATYGSGSSLMAVADSGLPGTGAARTIAWQRTGEAPTFALEANIAASGTTVRWAADLLGIDEGALAAMAADVDHTDVVLVPAFEGLGAPYWDRTARAVLTGFTYRSGQADVARAAIESIAYQVADALGLFATTPGEVRELRADGGPTANTALMQFQADICGRPVARSRHPENSALGAARLAGLALDLWDTDTIIELSAPGDVFTPSRDEDWRTRALDRWHDALRAAAGFGH